MSVSGRSVLVTGGASGIARAASLRLAREGARVVVADRNAAGAAAVAAEIAAAGGTALAVALDVAESRDVSEVVARTQREFGGIDVLVHAAGICPRRNILEMSDDEWRDVLRINLDGTFYVTRDVGRIIAKELTFGIIYGLLAGSLTGLLAFWLDGWNPWMGGVVFLAMVGNVALAALGGSLIPLALRALNIDPALASTVWLTTFTDWVGFLLLLGMGTVLVQRLT